MLLKAELMSKAIGLLRAFLIRVVKFLTLKIMRGYLNANQGQSAEWKEAKANSFYD